MIDTIRHCRIGVSEPELAAFCEKHHIVKLSVFGSAVRDVLRPESDVDVLVRFDPQHVPGYLRLFEIEEELASLFGGRKIEMVTEKFLDPRIRDDVVAEAEVQYVEG